MKYDKWTDEEDDFLINNWKKMTAKQMAAQLGRTHHAVDTRKYKIGLRGKDRKINDGLTNIQRYVKRHPEKVRAHNKKWRENNRDKCIEYSRLRKQRLRSVWGRSNLHKKPKAAVLKVEKYVAENVLPKMGYNKIFHFTPIHGFFPFDLKAEKDGEIHVFEVTTNVHHKVKNKFIIARELGLILIIIFISGDLKRVYIRKITNIKPKSVAIPESFIVGDMKWFVYQ